MGMFGVHLERANLLTRLVSINLGDIIMLYSLDVFYSYTTNTAL